MNGIDWDNISEVIVYCMTLGHSSIVFKHPDRVNYNITHKSRTDLYCTEWVIYDPTVRPIILNYGSSTVRRVSSQAI